MNRMNEAKLIREAREEISRGHYESAGTILSHVIKANPQNEEAWLVAASAADTDQEIEYLQRALSLNPGNQVTRARLAELGHEAPLVTSEEKGHPRPKNVVQFPTPPFSGQVKMILVTNTFLILFFSLTFFILVQQSHNLQSRLDALLNESDIPKQARTTDTSHSTSFSGQPIDQEVSTSTRPLPSTPTPAPFRVTPSPTPFQEVDFDLSQFLPVRISPPSAPTPIPLWSEMELPFPIRNVVPAMGGKYLIIRLDGLPTLLVYEPVEHQIISILRLQSEQFLYTAGGNLVLVYLEEENQLQTWSLETFTRIRARPNPMGNYLIEMVMGHSNSTRAFIRYAVGTDRNDPAGNYLLDTRSLTKIPYPERDEDPNNRHGHSQKHLEKVNWRSNATMTRITEQPQTSFPHGIGLYTFGNESWNYRLNYKINGTASPGENRFIYTSEGKICDVSLEEYAEIPGTALLTSHEGALVLGVDQEGKIHLYPPGSPSPLFALGTFPKFQTRSGSLPDGKFHSRFTQDQRIHLSAQDGYVIYTPPGQRYLYRKTFDLEQKLTQTGTPYLLVLSMPPPFAKAGHPWSYQIKTLSSHGPMTYSLDVSPDGMSVSPTGRLTWIPHISRTEGKEEIKVFIQDQAGNRTHHHIELTITPF